MMWLATEPRGSWMNYDELPPIRSFANDAITSEGYHRLIHALRHEWAADELDDAGRHEVLNLALG